MSITSDEKNLVLKVKRGDIFAFERLFKTHYKNLCLFAEFYVREKAMAEEIVGNFFLKFWEKRKHIDIKESAKSYFYKSIYNQSMKYLEHLKVMKKYEDYARMMLENKELLSPSTENYPLANLISKEIVHDIENAIDRLPEKCREIFCLCRFEDMTYEEISARLNISVNTVRTQMSRALVKLRESLKDYLPLFYIIFCSKLFVISKLINSIVI
jgi:RNA polymerase sigma-70 factor (ECF subfamily)